MRNPILVAIAFLLLLAGMFWVGYTEGKRAADKWYADPSHYYRVVLPSVRVQLPRCDNPAGCVIVGGTQP